MIFTEVAVAAPIYHTLTYSVNKTSSPDDVQGENYETNLIGRRVVVPLGKRRTTGYILSVTEKPAEENYRIRHIAEFPDRGVLFHENMAGFFKWAAEYYHYPIGLVIKAALPAGLTVQTTWQVTLKKGDSPIFAEKADNHTWINQLLQRKKLTDAEYRNIIETEEDRKLLETLSKSDVVAIDKKYQSVTPSEKLEICYSIADEKIRKYFQEANGSEDTTIYREGLKRILGFDVKLSEAKALYHIDRKEREFPGENADLKELRQAYQGIVKPLASLEENCLISKTVQRIYRAPIGARFKKYPRPSSLTTEQGLAVTEILSALDSGKFRTFLLHGVTGSGKTEVYLRAAEKALESGRDVLIMVPEIALATQLEAHLFSRFGEQVALIHSGMTKAEKFDQYIRVINGHAKIVIGARSAVFAPLANPGLIIVDEEHDNSYKQDDSFRYNGRDLAIVRARHHDCTILLGSATPSVTTYANAINGKYTLLEMHKRVGQGSLPDVEVVDLSKAIKNEGSIVLHKSLKKALSINLHEGRQSILLLNRRGFSSVFLCQDCGTPIQCTHCHVSLTLHKKKNRLICHYCGYGCSANTVCSQCRSANLVAVGVGTERVEDEARTLLPEARVARLDSDVSGDRKKFLDILTKMHNREIDILIGTQMIAKGHHFPDVTLVGVVLADGGMSMPDFRAAERTYQLLTQVIGRAGRGELPGKVIVQTLRPDHYAIEYARQHDYLSLYHHEMKLRANPSFPPYVRLICLKIQGRVESEVQKFSFEVARFCRKTAKEYSLPLDVLGPAPSPLDKIKDNYRWQILLKSQSSMGLHEVLKNLSNKDAPSHHRCTLAIDVDPENMM